MQTDHLLVLTDAMLIIGVSADGEQPYVDVESLVSPFRKRRLPVDIGLFSDSVPVPNNSVLLIWFDHMLSHIPQSQFQEKYAAAFYQATMTL